MRKICISVLLSFVSISLFSQTIDDLSFGTDSTLEIITWNLEWYPKVGNSTNFYLTQIIEALDCDIYALQEIHDTSYFNNLLKSLPDYDAYVDYNGNLSLAYLYKKQTIQVNDVFKIYGNKQRELPRSPLILDFCYDNQDFIAINNHLKCCGNGSLNQNDPWDEETRRRDACELIDKFIDDNHLFDNVIVLGDFNDLLIDNNNHNVFRIFLDDDANYQFADMEIADGGSQNWSYPDWPSHLDHILVTDELFDELSSNSSLTQTLKIEDYMSAGWSTYETYISDHRPVALKFKLNEPPVSVVQLNSLSSEFQVYPNPSNNQVVINFPPATDKTRISVYNAQQKRIVDINKNYGETTEVLDVSLFPSGVYIVSLIDDNRLLSVRRLVVR